MKANHVVVAVVVGAIVALLLWVGPDKVVTTAAAAAAAVEGFVLRALGQAEEARLATLRPQVREAFEGLRTQLAYDNGIDVFVVSTRRTLAQQAEKVKTGRSDTMDTWHLEGVDRALDIEVIDPDTGKRDSAGKRADLYLTMHKVASDWGFRGIAFDLATGKKRFLKSGAWDAGHLEYREGLTYAAAKAQPRENVG